MKWEMGEALDLVRMLAEKLKPRYHPALTGSVLLKGGSNNDLDIILYPGSTADQDKTFVAEVLTQAGLKRVCDRSVVQAKWRQGGSKDEKHVEVWRYGGKRVDIFFLV